MTMEVAEKALRKLRAQNITPKGSPHPIFAVYHEGRIVATTGLRHSSKKDILVPHVKRDLRVSAPFILELAHCTKGLDDWLQAVGLMPADDDQADVQQ